MTKEGVEPVAGLGRTRLYVEPSIIRVIRSAIRDEICESYELIVPVGIEPSAQVNSPKDPAHFRPLPEDREVAVSKGLSKTFKDGRATIAAHPDPKPSLGSPSLMAARSVKQYILRSSLLGDQQVM